MVDTPQPLRVGWIGTGRMGFAMARRLARSGINLTVWNRTRSKAEPLADDGARVVERIADLGGCDVVFTMVASSPDLEEVLAGPEGLLRKAEPKPQIVVDCSTVSVETSAAMRTTAAKEGVQFLAAPVSGNDRVVAAGKLSIVASGPRETFDRVEPLLRTIGSAAIYAGDGEIARLVKICHNLLLAAVIQSVAETAVLAERAGVPRATYLEFINASVMGSMFTRYKTPSLVYLDWTPTFTLELLRKDLDLGLAAARALDVPMPVAAVTHEVVQAALGRGHRGVDFAVLLLEAARNAGFEPAPETAQVDDGLGGNS
ncbi:MAG: NAD(P)-dependent oxidoreductase [Acidothermus cellulolyticus]|nr:NAD(P)-dependent oxidoreductase [Acidothermus cellulolyticus]